LIVCLVPQPAVDVQNRDQNLRCIATYETWIKIAGILITRESSNDRWGFSEAAGGFHLLDYFTDGEIESLKFSHEGERQYGSLHEDHWKRDFQIHVQEWSMDKVAGSICEDASHLFTVMVREQVRMLNLTRREELDAVYNVNMKIPEWFAQNEKKVTRGRYLYQLAKSQRQHKHAFENLLKIFEDYRGAIRHAAIASHLTDKHLKFLRKKLEGVEDQFAKACKACDYEPKEEHLIYLDSDEWW
jgi:hypothetical protein